MPTTNEKGGASSPRFQRYRPAAEFDDATLAQKREYWRTKKREQRAKLAERRGRPKASNKGVGNASLVLNSSVSRSLAVSGPPLLNSDGSYQTEAGDGFTVLLRGKEEADLTDIAGQNQKERWFQRIKLNKVLPQFPVSNPGPIKGPLVINKPSGVSVSRTLTSAKPNGVLNNPSAVPQVRVTAHPSGSAPRQPQGETSILNGSFPGGSAQQNLATQGASGPNVFNKTQVTVHIRPRPLKANITTGMNMTTSHFAPVLISKSVGNAAQLGSKNIALGAAQRVKRVNDTVGKPETEEERAAKRREQWRIKKREQRAKQAAMLAKARERTQSLDTAPQRAGQLANVGLERPSPALNREGQWHSVGRARTPLTTAGRLLRNAKAMAASCAVPKHAGVTVKKEAGDLSLSLDQTSTATHNVNIPSVQIKTEDSSVAPLTTHTAAITATGHDRTMGDPSRRFSSHAQFHSINRGIVRSRTPRQRFIETQRVSMAQRNIRGRSPSLATAFITCNVPKENPFETPEQKAARRREYWRVKKREQRAKLSVEVKARMKEKDALMRRVKRYQSILQDMRKARAAGCHSLSQPIGSTHTNASETIGGFIKEDGTVTIPHITLNTSETQIGGEGCHASRNMALGRKIQIHPPPPPLRPAQVKVFCPTIGQSVNKPPKLLSIRPRAQFESPARNPPSSHTLVVQPSSQITLTHPPNPFPSVSVVGAKPAGCVMQMAVTSSQPIRVQPNLGPELTEEERMVRKREYWRVKKREQRAARAARQKQGVVHGRCTITLQRRRNQRSRPVRRVALTNPKLSILPPSSTSITTPTQTTQIKQEKESISAEDPIPESERPGSVDIKPLPSSLQSTQEPQPEPDPALSADSHATTLLAVASMKRLLEESLSNVTECTSQLTDSSDNKQLPCKTEPAAYAAEPGSELETKPHLPQLTVREEEKVSTAGDLAPEEKCWQGEPVGLFSGRVCSSPPIPDVKASALSSEPPSSTDPACTETVHLPTLPPPPPSLGTPPHTVSCTPTTSSSNPQPPLPRRAQRLREKKAGHHHCCSPEPAEPPKLHHPPLLLQQQQQPPQQQQQQHTSKQEHSSKQQQQQQPHSCVPEQNMTLQKKREYWRMMKRQQRARSKARQRDVVRPGDYSRRLALKAAQVPNVLIVKNSKPVQKSLQAPPTLRPKPSPLLQPTSSPVSGAHASLTAVTNIPTLLVVSPTVATVGQPPDTLQVKPAISSLSSPPQQVNIKMGNLQTSTSFSPVSLPVSRERKEGRLILVENKQEAAPGSSTDSPLVRKWSLQVQDPADSVISPIPTLTPPANPLASIKLLPIEPSPSSKFPVASKPHTAKPLNSQSGKMPPPASSWLPITTTGPPKPIPGESEEDTLRRKREYWRVKKKEQRARKAMRDRDLSQKRASSNWKPLLPAQDIVQRLDDLEQDSGQWINASEESDLLLSTSAETDLDYFTNSDHTAPIEDEADVLFPSDGHNMDDAEISEAMWRHRYLMDHDPLNQLLVCMVCGDLQYSHSVEGVKTHIEEAHPETLGLEAPERRRILEAWDEQVSQRERFFTSQLQQHGGPLTGDGETAEIEVMMDTEDSSQLNNSKVFKH